MSTFPPQRAQSAGAWLFRWKGPPYVIVYERVPSSGPPSCVSKGGYLGGRCSAQIGGNLTALAVVLALSDGWAGPTWLVSCGAWGHEELRVSQEGAASELAARLPSDSRGELAPVGAFGSMPLTRSQCQKGR